ncbi:DNA-binding protein [Blastococcus sp. TBT05-19]|nr:DNA-binding protein [Blastococcus sp. TBT05-19]
MTKTWTPDEVRCLGVRTDLVTACEIAYGARRTKAYELFRRGELDFPAVRVGSRVVVPVAALCRFLGIDLEKADASAAHVTSA